MNKASIVFFAAFILLWLDLAIGFAEEAWRFTIGGIAMHHVTRGDQFTDRIAVEGNKTKDSGSSFGGRVSVGRGAHTFNAAIYSGSGTTTADRQYSRTGRAFTDIEVDRLDVDLSWNVTAEVGWNTQWGVSYGFKYLALDKDASYTEIFGDRRATLAYVDTEKWYMGAVGVWGTWQPWSIPISFVGAGTILAGYAEGTGVSNRDRSIDGNIKVELKPNQTSAAVGANAVIAIHYLLLDHVGISLGGRGHNVSAKNLSESHASVFASLDLSF